MDDVRGFASELQTVVLVLAITLIITIPIQLHAVNLNMPVGNPPPNLVKPDVRRIDIDAASVVSQNGEAIAQRGELERRMAVVSALPVQPEVPLRPDRKARHEVVASVLALAQRTGLTKIGVVGSEQPPPPPPPPPKLQKTEKIELA